MAAKATATDSSPLVTCKVLRGRILLDGKIYVKGDTIDLPADKIDVHPLGMLEVQ